MTTILLSRFLPDEICEYMMNLSGHIFRNKPELQFAIEIWCEDKQRAFKEYGDIRYRNIQIYLYI